MMRSFIETGRALHFTELGAAMGLAPEAGKALLHDLMGSGVPSWLHPDTDYVVSLGPFNNMPTQYRISVNGEKAVRRGVFRSVPELIAVIERFLEHHNEDPKSFTWEATADAILEKVARAKAVLVNVH